MPGTMEPLLVLLIAAMTVRADSFVDDVNTRVDRILKLVLPKESFLEKFFDVQGDKECASSESDVNDVVGMPLTPEDFAVGQKINENFFGPPPGADPIHKSGHFEGDIKNPKFIEGRNAIRDSHMKWPGGEVPYVIANSFDREERGVIARAMEEYHKKTCIRFLPRTTEYDFVFITKKDGCFSMIGRDGGLQLLSLGDGCMFVGIVVHEFMHAIGFWHEQSRADRDEFVTILWDNIRNGQTHNFAKYTDGRLHHLGEHYDYNSIMHYGIYEFSKFRNRPTILPKQRNAYIGQRMGFSNTDIRKINKLYKCDQPAKEDCVDTDSQCSGWAQLGECEKNPRWMLMNCRRSCNQCKRTFSVMNNSTDL